MSTMKIVADSSANILQLQQVSFGAAPMKIITDEREFVDDEQLDVEAMVSWFDSYKGKSKTSCPNSSDWLEAFGDADHIFCVTITSGLSGSYNSACIAKQIYEADHPGRRVFVIDSLSAGPELALTIEKLAWWIGKGADFDTICREITDYQKRTGLLFMLQEMGLRKGKVRIAHCENEAAAQELKTLIEAAFPNANVQIQSCLGLCSYYAEKGGLLVGFEKI